MNDDEEDALYEQRRKEWGADAPYMNWVHQVRRALGDECDYVNEELREMWEYGTHPAEAAEELRKWY